MTWNPEILVNETREKRVRFSTIEIHEFPMILGDNPADPSGVPLTLDWDAQQEYRMSLDRFESCRPERRFHDDLKIPPKKRIDIAMKGGCSLTDIAMNIVMMSKIQEHRVESASEQSSSWELLRTTCLFKKRRKTRLFQKVPTDAPRLLKLWRDSSGRSKVVVLSPAA